MGISYYFYIRGYSLSDTRKALGELIFSFEHRGKTINHGGDDTFKHNFKLRILLTLINLLDEMVENTDHKFFLLGTWKFPELDSLHHETTENRGNILLGETIVDVLNFEIFYFSPPFDFFFAQRHLSFSIKSRPRA